MSAAVKQAAIDEALELSYLFRQNAALKHGLPEAKKTSVKYEGPDPKPEPVKVDIHNHIPAANAATTDSPSPGLGAAASSSLLRRAAPYLLTAAGAGSLPFVADWVIGDKQPIAPPAVAVPSEAERDGSLLQYLQDQGAHLPEGWSSE